MNDWHWKEYDDGKRASLFSADGEEIAYIQKYEPDLGSAWICSIYPRYICEKVYWKDIDSLEEAEWAATLYIYDKCNEVANQLHKIRDHLPSLHELRENALNKSS